MQKVYLGETPERFQDKDAYPDVSKRELAVLVPLAAVTLYMGIFPAGFMDMYRGFIVEHLVPVLSVILGSVGGLLG